MLNFGPQYEFAYAEGPTPLKKFKGVLDAHFDKLREGQEDEATEETNGEKAEKADAEKEQAGKEKADKEKADKEKEKADKEKTDKEKADKEAADKEKEKADKEKEKAGQDKEKADKEKPGEEMADEEKAGRTELGVVLGGHKCLWDGTQLQVEMAAGATGNKKIPPKTVLAFTTEGKVWKSGKGIPWTFDSGKDLVVHASKLDKAGAGIGPEVVETLALFMDRVGATSIIKHSWTLQEIKSGKKLTASGNMMFHPDNDVWRSVLENFSWATYR